MANSLAVAYKADGIDIKLNKNIVVNYLTGGKDVPDDEIAKFLMKCKANQLNPFTGDVYMSVYNTRDGIKTETTVSRDFFRKRAAKNPSFKGIKSGVTFIGGDGVYRHRRGAAVYKELGEQLLGGWAEVSVDGFEEPVYAEVPFSEYDKGRATWKSIPCTMIVKCAEAAALRSAFPCDFSGLYCPEEMGDAINGAEQREEVYEIPTESVESVSSVQSFDPPMEYLENGGTWSEVEF